MTTLRKTVVTLLLSGLIFASSAKANGWVTYHVTITNLTNAITFTPILVASHKRSLPLFELGAPASEEMAAIAEAGDISLLEAALAENRTVADVQNSGGLLFPGASVTVVVRAAYSTRRISLAAMMLPTNDGFIALDGVRAPKYGSVTHFSPGYDSGTEDNDEWCMNIPGPTCKGAGPSPGENNPGDEGYVHIHRGIQGAGDLSPRVYDWRNPVAKIKITRMRY